MSNIPMHNSSSLQKELLAMSVAAAASMSAAKESDLQLNKSTSSRKSKSSSRAPSQQNKSSSRAKESVNDLGKLFYALIHDPLETISLFLASFISSKSNEILQSPGYSR